MNLQNMNKIDWARKLTSRKLWLAIANFVTMLIIALGGTNSEAAQVSALIIAGATVIAYIIGEGLADAGNSTVISGDMIISDESSLISDTTNTDDGK